MIHGDSFEILPLMKENSADLILTDPPYDGLTRTAIEELHRQFMRISRRGVIVFCPPENPWVTPADQYLFWIKPTSTKNTSKRYSRFVEQIFLYGDLKWNTGRFWAQYTNIFMDLVDDPHLHPFRKPPSLIERLILNHSDEGDHILDPFAGSGVVASVGERLGRTVTSIEIDEEYNVS